MESRGYTLPPVQYQMPAYYLKKDSRGHVIDERIFLTWPSESHSLAFFLLWNRYHWESQDGADTVVIQLKCPIWQTEESNPRLRAALGDRAALLPDDFLDYLTMLQ
eukprot:2379500-Prorocentrum_lima.AAC.1